MNPTGLDALRGSPPSSAGLDGSGLLYEPRGFWSIGYQNGQTGTLAYPLENGVVRLSRDDFRNGSRYPIVLTRLSIAAINYTLRQYATNPVSPATNRNDSCNFRDCDILIGAPQRQWYSKRWLPLTALSARATGEPGMQPSSVGYASGLFGISRMVFDKPLVLPQLGAIELGVGCFRNAASITSQTSMPAWLHVESQHGGIWPGAARSEQETLVTYSGTASTGPYVDDAFTGNAVAGAVARDIPITQTFTAQEFVKQDPERGRAGSRVFTGAQVFVDQYAFDEQVQTSLLANVPASSITPMSLRLPCAMRARGGGTGEWFWKPNAPLGLMFNEITPALVYDLPQPITLRDGDCLDVALRFPFTTSKSTAPNYQIGVAFTGYAVVNG